MNIYLEERAFFKLAALFCDRKIPRKLTDDTYHDALYKLLNYLDVGQGIESWIKKAEDLLSFSKTAKEKFENGTLKEKRQILQAFGSNLVLKDRILTITLPFPLKQTKSLAKSIQTIHERLEPLNSCSKQVDLGEEYAQNEIWWR